MKIKKITFITSILLLFGVMNFVVQGFVFANETEEEIDKIVEEIEKTCEQEGLTEEECERAIKKAEKTDDEADELKQKMKNAERMAELKQQQQRTLRNQMELLNLQIESMEEDVNAVKAQIENTKNKISKIKLQIDEKQENITDSKEKLSEIIKVYHRINQEIGLKMMSSGGSLTQIFNQSEYLSQTSRQVKKSLDAVKEEKEELNEKQSKLKEKKEELSNKEAELEKKQKSLDSKKQQKQTLIARTQNEEAQYRALVDKIENQMRNLLIDIESLSDAKKRRLRLIQEGAIDPTSGLASESWYYAQDDSEWADDKIAGTNLSMEGWGCAISSVAMVLSYYEEDIKPDDIAENISYFSSGNLVWSEVAKAASEDFNVYDSRHLGSKGVDEDDLMDYVDSGYPVIVFIRADSSLGGYPKGHYVVVHGYDDDHDDFVVHDPIGGTGPNSLLQTSKDYVSELYGGVTIDQMIVYKPE